MLFFPRLKTKIKRVVRMKKKKYIVSLTKLVTSCTFPNNLFVFDICQSAVWRFQDKFHVCFYLIEILASINKDEIFMLALHQDLAKWMRKKICMSAVQFVFKFEKIYFSGFLCTFFWPFSLFGNMLKKDWTGNLWCAPWCCL